MTTRKALPTRILGRTGAEVTALGLGGEGILRTWGRDRRATALIHKALDLGVTYFDSAQAYDGSEDYYGLVWGFRREVRRGIFLCSKTADRTRLGAKLQLETTLNRMNTDYLDLWQVHDLRTPQEWEFLKGPDGALETFMDAKRRGVVRFIGVTGHADPFLLAQAIKEFEFDTVLMPVNAPEAILRGFLDVTLPVAQEKDLGVIGMKVLSRGLLTRMGIPPSTLIRFGLYQPVSTIIVGCDSLAQLQENVEAAKQPPLSEEETRQLLDAVAPYAGQLAFYRNPCQQAA